MKTKIPLDISSGYAVNLKGEVVNVHAAVSEGASHEPSYLVNRIVVMPLEYTVDKYGQRISEPERSLLQYNPAVFGDPVIYNTKTKETLGLDRIIPSVTLASLSGGEETCPALAVYRHDNGQTWTWVDGRDEYHIIKPLGFKLIKATLKLFRADRFELAPNSIDEDLINRITEKKRLYLFKQSNGRIHVFKDLGAFVRKRTAMRISYGQYKAVPETFKTIAEHGVHVSTNDDSKIAFYPDERSARRDVPLAIRPGKYLRKYFPDMTDDEIRVMAGKLGGGLTLKELNSSIDMVKVYRDLADRGIVSSCMSHSRGSWSSIPEHHPLDAYDYSDVILLVVYNAEGDPIARTLANKVTKEYPIIYGQWEKAEPVIQKAGYKHGSLDGARINRINDGYRIIMPYIDGHRDHSRNSVNSTCITIHDDHCIIDCDGNIEANKYSEGYVTVDDDDDDEDTLYCDCCGEDHNEDYMIRTLHDGLICESCADAYYIYADDGRGHGGYVHQDDSDLVEINCTWYIDEDAANRAGYVYGTYSKKWIRYEDAIEAEGETLSSDDLDYAVFEIDDEYFLRDTVISTMYYDREAKELTSDENEYTTPVRELKKYFETKPDGVHDAIWRNLPIRRFIGFVEDHPVIGEVPA